ncbi:MAG: methyltransferase domain-containing protein [Gammaproteobacteria bacterium]|nr:methyltransferase domain-containing protein [Gammaproteobacteria bacterium]MCY4165513.1 methyltransferase domain-containing protein [Gammaproteobacteria bacterium]MCY4339882.1 methyltransferase domain-containing protein [Gammaproteobacteria bacterium]
MADNSVRPGKNGQLGGFLRSLASDPRAVGAVAPSGRALGRLMARGCGSGACVVEVGPGTGALTSAILDKGVSESDLCLVERDERFVEILKTRFPGVRTVHGDATALSEHLEDLAGRVDFVISSLPLLLLPDAAKRSILAAAFSLLADGGAFHQFTYGGICPVGRGTLESLGIKASFLGFAALNMPPAFVYRFQHA